MSLWSHTAGEGPALVAVHGWAMHSAVWSDFMDRLRERYRVTCIDLPGHGRSANVPVPDSLDGWAAACAEVAPPRAIWVGWSLGAQVALRFATRCPGRVERLVLFGATPRFEQAADWPRFSCSRCATSSGWLRLRSLSTCQLSSLLASSVMITS